MDTRLENCDPYPNTANSAATSASKGQRDLGTTSKISKLKLCPDPKQTAAEIVEKTNKLNAMLKELEPSLKPLVGGLVSFQLDSSTMVNQLQGKAPLPPLVERSGYQPARGHRYNQLVDRAIAIASFLKFEAKDIENVPKLLEKDKERFPSNKQGKKSQEELDNLESNRLKLEALRSLAGYLTNGVYNLNLDGGPNASVSDGEVSNIDFSASSQDRRIQLLRQK